jgi:NAD(P)-dependent dehydrogenase (short-subunit alcohol dehydrogenase family)
MAVLVTDVDLDAARAVAEVIVAAGGTAAARELDVADERNWTAVVAEAETLFGPVGIFAGNAGLTAPEIMAQDLGVLDLDMALWDRVIGVNLRGNVLGCRALLPGMIAAGKGAIIFTSSILGTRAGPARSAYSVSKAGLEGLMRAIARTYGRFGIRCNAVAPGFVLTDGLRGAVRPERLPVLEGASPLGRLAVPGEIADMVAFLAGDGAAFVTGQSVMVDGGVAASLPI